MYTADELEIRCALAGSPRAEQLIACLEGEIAKRDETIARLEPQLNRAIQANYDLREELAAIKAQGVVMPPPPYMPEVEPAQLTDYERGEAQGRCDMWAEVARLNAAPAADAGLVDALEMIVNPIEAMRRELQVGEQLNGMVAMQLASDPEYLRGVAKAALAAHRSTGVV